jgi:hypothetical protein
MKLHELSIKDYEENDLFNIMHDIYQEAKLPIRDGYNPNKHYYP